MAHDANFILHSNCAPDYNFKSNKMPRLQLKIWRRSPFSLVLVGLAILASLLTVHGYMMIPYRTYSIRSSLAAQSEDGLPNIQLPEDTITEQSTCVITKKIRMKPGRWRSLSRLLQKNPKDLESPSTLKYTYKYDKLLLQPTLRTNSMSSSTIGIVLVHPIGVGIARWFYERLLNAFSSNADRSDRLLIISPDLLGSGSACDPAISNSDQSIPKHLPLLNISDWTAQLIDLMVESEASQAEHTIDRWCIVANGGCSPIALQVAEKASDPSCPLTKPVSSVIISSAPRLPFFFNASDSSKVSKAYARLCGLVGRLFWWYACRKEGKFIQTFSEKNLVANPDNLGDTWRSNCYQTAVARGGMSRYSTFAFLAGTLQDGCQQSLDTLKNKNNVQVDIIRGRDVRKNKARSWFWQKSKREATSSEESSQPQKTFRDLVEENGNGGKEMLIGGRVSLAHEDPEGYCNAVLSFLQR
jgi:hypothetical protein